MTQSMTNTTQTESNPLDLLTTAERAQVLAQLESLPRTDREELAATGRNIGWMRDLASHILAWRGRE